MLRSSWTISLAVLIVLTTIMAVGVSVVRANELGPAKILTMGLPVAIIVVATLTLVCAVIGTIHKQRLTLKHKAVTERDNNPSRAQIQANPTPTMMDQPTRSTGTGITAHLNYCDRCGNRLT